MPTFFTNNKKLFLILGLIFATTALVYPFGAGAEGVISNTIMGSLWFLVTSVFGWLVWAAGLLLNVSIDSFVVGFGELFETSGLGYSVNSLWSVVRDIFNLTFIFGLVYIGFKMILNSSDSTARKMLVSLVIAALLVNFSLFFTKFIIDFSNIAATQFAQAFNAGGTYTVSDGFMKLLGLSSMWDTASGVGKLDAPAGFAYIFGSLFLYLTTAFVFAAGGILLIIRFVVLNFYMILSPLMFLGFVFPGLGNISKEYWQGFLGRAFFAPAYLLMLYFAHQILVNMQGVVTAGSQGMANAFGTKDAAAATSSFEGTIVFFIVTSVFLVAALVVAQKMGAVGASNAIAIGKRFAGKATRATTYAPRALGRMGVNKVGEAVEKKLNNAQTGNGKLAKFLKLNKVDQVVRGTATAAAGAQYGTGTTNKAERDYKAKTQSRANQTEAENNRKTGFDTHIASIKDATKSSDDLTKALDDLGKTVRGMSKDEKNHLSLADLTNKSVAVNLSDDDIKNLEAAGTFSAAEIQQVKDARKYGFSSIAKYGSTLTDTDKSGKVTNYSHANAGTTDPATGDPTAILVDRRQSLAAKGTKEVGNLPMEVFKESNMYAYITPSMLEERMRNGIDISDKAAVRNALSAHLQIDPGVLPSDSMLLSSNPWVKWEKSNSTYAAQFFA